MTNNACGRGRFLPSDAQACVQEFACSAFIAFPFPRNSAGSGKPVSGMRREQLHG